jgi:hypothetical protein
LLFVNCVWKPRNPSVRMAEVKAGRTDHTWVLACQDRLDGWLP